MKRLTRAARFGRGGGQVSVTLTRVGNALLVHDEGAQPAESTLAAVAALPADPGRTLVAVSTEGETTKPFWTAVAGLLTGHGALRLVVPRAAVGSPCPGQFLADRLATEVLAPAGDVVSAQGGTLFAMPGTDRGRTGWLRFLPGTPPQVTGLRLPMPPWEAHTPPLAWPLTGGAVAEPVAAGVWLRPADLPASARGQGWARAVTELPCRADTVTVVVGAPGADTVSLDDVCQFLTELPAPARAAVRLTVLGPVSGLDGAALGQAVADRTGTRLRVQPGLGDDVFCVNPAGEPTWQPFATELTHLPGAAPLVSRHRLPLPGLRPVGPGVFRWNEHIVVEVVQAGLWVHEARDTPAGGATVEQRLRPCDPEWAMVIVGSPDRPVPARLAGAASELVGRLDAGTRRWVRLSFAGAQDASATPAEPDDDPLDMPTMRVAIAPLPPMPAAAAPPTHTPAAVPAPAPAWAQTSSAAPATQPQVTPAARPSADHPAGATPDAVDAVRPARPPVPATADSPPATGRSTTDGSSATIDSGTAGPPGGAVDPQAAAGSTDGPPARTGDPGDPPVSTAATGRAPLSLATEPAPGAPRVDPRLVRAGYRSSPEERHWLRSTLGEHQELFAAVVRRTVAQHPGLVLPQEDQDAAVTDLIAVYVYLAAEANKLDERFRGEDLGPLRAYGCCMVSGLARLPSYRGTTTSATLTPGNFEGALEPGATVTLRTPSAAVIGGGDGTAPFLLWSGTARRVEQLDPRAGEHDAERVVFFPNTVFRVLDHTGDGPDRRFLLREVAPVERDPEARDTAVLAALRPGVGAA